MTAQNLYNKFLKKEISKEKFLYEVRKQSHLPITKFNSFEDTVKILKSKRIISENNYKEDKNIFTPKKEFKTIDEVSPNEYFKGVDFELDLINKSVGLSSISEEEIRKAQDKVLKNLSNNPYYYSDKLIIKDLEDENQHLEELGKNNKAKNQMEKGKLIKENSDYINAEDLGFNLEDFDLLDDGSLLDPETNKKVFNGSTGNYDRMYLKKYLEKQKSINENHIYSKDKNDEYNLKVGDKLIYTDTEDVVHNHEIIYIGDGLVQTTNDYDYKTTKIPIEKINYDIRSGRAKLNGMSRHDKSINEIKQLNENLDQYYSQDDEDLDMDLSHPDGYFDNKECDGCKRNENELDMDVMDPNELERLSRIIEEWGLTANDIHDVDIMDELANEFMRRSNEESEMNEGVALTDSEGNISYVKDEQSANKKIENARKAGVTLNKQTVN